MKYEDAFEGHTVAPFAGRVNVYANVPWAIRARANGRGWRRKRSFVVRVRRFALARPGRIFGVSFGLPFPPEPEDD
jgi:hypothetical protein